VPGVPHTQPYRQTASSPKSSRSILSSASDEDKAIESGPGEQTQQAGPYNGHALLALRAV